jgi:hypothetical protein
VAVERPGGGHGELDRACDRSSFFASAVNDWPLPPDARFGEYLDHIALGDSTTIQRR